MRDRVRERAEGPRSHDSVAWCYDTIARLYSAGRISRAKLWQVEYVKPGDRVLYLGVGSGEDALHAARRGGVVTGLDVSAAMLRRAQRRFEAAGSRADWVRGDLCRFEAQCGFDLVAANFVLNVYGPAAMRRALARTCALVRPGGTLLLADFAPPAGGAIARAVCRAYYRPINLAACAIGLCSLHPIYDYAACLQGSGFELLARAGFALAPGLASFYEASAWVRRR